MRRFLALLVLACGLPAISSAALVTVEFSGTIDQQIGFSPALIGQSITGTYTYESDTAATVPGFYAGAVSQITADFGGNSFVVNGTGNLAIADDNPAFGGDSTPSTLPLVRAPSTARQSRWELRSSPFRSTTTC
jgi:hypothetical protein